MSIPKTVLSICLLFCIEGLYAQQSPEDICRIFFEKYKTQQSDSALDYLFKTNKFSSEAKEQTESLKLSLKQVFASNGNYFGNELLSKKTAGSCIVMFTYLVKHEKEPLLFRLSFYKPLNTWEISDFKFTSKIDEELEEASRAYRFKENIED